MAAKPFLMGAEVEYSMSSPRRRGASDRALLHRRLLDAIRADHCWLPDAASAAGIYLDNGARYYLDTGNHNEFSSPELFTPRQVAVYDRAAEQILLRAQAEVRRQHQDEDVCITKNNVNFSLPDSAAWGQHEAYTCWIPMATAAAQLIPHLVSRLPYAGAGCLCSHPHGVGFELSQRARHMTRAMGRETTGDRAIFCTRVNKSSDYSEAGWTRTNLISKDSQRCSFGMYLSYGVTGLLFMILNEGHKIGRGLQLEDPVAAMQAFSRDPRLQQRVALVGGRQVTAIEIQRAYLRAARPHVESGDYPDWTGEVWSHWAATLDQLEQNPLDLAARLDPYLKLAVFERQLARAGFSWSQVRQALGVLDQMRRAAPERFVRAVLDDDRPSLDAAAGDLYDQLARIRAAGGVDPAALRFTVRLQALELNYHDLGGLFDQLVAAGQVDAVVVTPPEVARAVHAPPAGGRAEARAACIKELHGQRWLCNWQYVMRNDQAEWFDLRDPFSNARQAVPLTAENPAHPERSTRAALLTRLLHLFPEF